jgi:hypothetical protein
MLVRRVIADARIRHRPANGGHHQDRRFGDALPALELGGRGRSVSGHSFADSGSPACGALFDREGSVILSAWQPAASLPDPLLRLSVSGWPRSGCSFALFVVPGWAKLGATAGAINLFVIGLVLRRGTFGDREAGRDGSPRV